MIICEKKNVEIIGMEYENKQETEKVLSLFLGNISETPIHFKGVKRETNNPTKVEVLETQKEMELLEHFFLKKRKQDMKEMLQCIQRRM